MPNDPQAPFTGRAGYAAYLADDVTVGQLVRRLNEMHIAAAKETPPNRDYMRALQSSVSGIENALNVYRIAEPHNARELSDGSH